MFDIVLENGHLITMNNNNDILYNKDIFIKDGKIIAIKDSSNKKNFVSKSNYDVTSKYLLLTHIRSWLSTHIFRL